MKRKTRGSIEQWKLTDYFEQNFASRTVNKRTVQDNCMREKMDRYSVPKVVASCSPPKPLTRSRIYFGNKRYEKKEHIQDRGQNVKLKHYLNGYIKTLTFNNREPGHITYQLENGLNFPRILSSWRNYEIFNNKIFNIYHGVTASIIVNIKYLPTYSYNIWIYGKINITTSNLLANRVKSTWHLKTYLRPSQA